MHRDGWTGLALTLGLVLAVGVLVIVVGRSSGADGPSSALVGERVITPVCIEFATGTVGYNRCQQQLDEALEDVLEILRERLEADR